MIKEDRKREEYMDIMKSHSLSILVNKLSEFGKNVTWPYKIVNKIQSKIREDSMFGWKTPDAEDCMMGIMRVCAESPVFRTTSTLINAHGKSAEAIYHIQNVMAETDPHKKGLSSKDIINHLMDKGNALDAVMKRQIRAELMRGARNGDLGYVDDEYTRRKYYLRY